MLELLAAIQEVEPTAWPLVAIMLSSAAMYAVGILMPCSTCCGCGLCLEGKLPDTVTVAVSGYADGQLKTVQLGYVNFTSNFGSGAEAVIAAPTGTPGPITAVTVTNGGSGYARLSRMQPQISIAPPSPGSGAAFNVTLEQFTFNARPAWRIASVAITSGGSGYFGASRFFSVSAADGVTVLAGGFTAAVDTAAPTLSLTIPSPGSGSGASLEPVLTEFTDFFNNQRWAPNAVTVTAAGAGYETGTEVRVVLGSGTQGNTSWRAYITEVDENGGIVAVTVPVQYTFYGFYGTTGTIVSVSLTNPGNFYRDDPTGPGEVATITATAAQYLPNAAGNGYAGPDPAASGAVLQAVVDNTPTSQTFGKITGVTITSGGSGYAAWRYRPSACCADYWNGKTMVLKRDRVGRVDNRPSGGVLIEAQPCVYTKLVCGTTGSSSSSSTVEVEYRGPSTPPVARIYGSPCYVEAVATANVSDCDDFAFTAESPDGVDFSVTTGGDFDAEDLYNTSKPAACVPCCRDLDDVPDEVSAKLYKKNPQTNAMELVGTFVLTRWADSYWRFQGTLEQGTPANSLDTEIGVSIEQCQQPPWGVYGGGYSGGSYPGDTAGCSDCWKKCTVVAQYIRGVDLRSDTGNAFWRYRSDRCSGCATSPMCEPAAGTKQLRVIQVNTTTVLNGDVGDYAIEVEA